MTLLHKERLTQRSSDSVAERCVAMIYTYGADVYANVGDVYTHIGVIYVLADQFRHIYVWFMHRLRVNTHTNATHTRTRFTRISRRFTRESTRFRRVFVSFIDVLTPINVVFKRSLFSHTLDSQIGRCGITVCCVCEHPPAYSLYAVTWFPGIVTVARHQW